MRGGAAEPGGAAEVAAPGRLRIGPFFEAFLLARKEAERTEMKAIDLKKLVQKLGLQTSGTNKVGVVNRSIAPSSLG